MNAEYHQILRSPIHCFILILTILNGCEEPKQDIDDSDTDVGTIVDRPVKGLQPDHGLSPNLGDDLGLPLDMMTSLNDMSPIEMTQQDMLVQDMLVQDMLVQDMLVQDMLVQDMLVQDMLVQDMLVQDMLATVDYRVALPLDQGIFNPSLDTDNDGEPNIRDNCPLDYNQEQEDQDNDGYGDICDNCPLIDNQNQQDSNDNGVGDVCEYTGDGIEIILTHSGDSLDNDTFLEVTHPYASRFGSEVCSPENAFPACLIDDRIDSIQRLVTVPIYEGTYLVSVRFSDELNTHDMVKVQITCREQVRQFTLSRESETSESVWDIGTFSWPTCRYQEINHFNNLTCDESQCSCINCVESVCAPRQCSAQVGCNGFTGECDTTCGGRLCQANQICNQRTNMCESEQSSEQCTDCSNRIRCAFGYYCFDYLLTSGVCLKECSNDLDCGRGEICLNQLVNFDESRLLCINPQGLCD